eukprot:575058-Prymnesium_polylepis.3
MRRRDSRSGAARARVRLTGELVLFEQLDRWEGAEDEADGDEVAQDEALVLERARGRVHEREVELGLRARELRVEQREAADKELVRDELRDGEALPVEGLAVEGLGEAGPLDGADEVLAQPQRAPLFRRLERRAVGHDDLERLLQYPRGLLQLARLLAALLGLRVRVLRRPPQVEVEHVQRRHRPRRVLVEDLLERRARALLVGEGLLVVAGVRVLQEAQVLEQHLVVRLLEAARAQLLQAARVHLRELREQRRVAHVHRERRGEQRAVLAVDRLRDRLRDRLARAELRHRVVERARAVWRVGGAEQLWVGTKKKTTRRQVCGTVNSTSIP